METFGYHLDTRMYPNVSSASTSCWLFYPGVSLHTPPPLSSSDPSTPLSVQPKCHLRFWLPAASQVCRDLSRIPQHFCPC